MWGGAAQIDLVIVSDDEHRALALEMEALVAPADPREVHERSLEIRRDIARSIRRRVREIVECSGGVLSRHRPSRPRSASESAVRQRERL